MSTNLYAALRRILPPESILLVRVLEHGVDDDDTSLVELPAGIGGVPVTEGVTAGNTFRVRGRTVAVGKNAFVRGGVIESEAPEGDPVEIVVGAIIPGPRGPQGLQYQGPLPAQAATVGQPYLLDLGARVTAFYAPRQFTLVAGSLAGTGLSLNAGTGALAGTPSAAGTVAGLRVRCTDATGLYVETETFSIVVSA